MTTTAKRALLSGREYDKYFPAPSWRKSVVLNHMQAKNVVEQMGRIVCETQYQTAAIARVLFRESRTASRLDVLERVYTFTHNHIQYEKEEEEQLREPARLWAERKGDCDCYSIFIGSILRNLNIPFVFRITKYKAEEEWAHVYIVAFDEYERPVYLDCVLPKFNTEHPYLAHRDYGLPCGQAMAGPPGAENTETENESVWKKIAAQYVNIAKKADEAEAQNAIMAAVGGDFQNIISAERLSAGAQGILGDLMGTAAGVTCAAFGVPPSMCASAGKLLGDFVQPALFEVFGWSAKQPKTAEKEWADQIAGYAPDWVISLGITNSSDRRDNVRNDFNRLFGGVDSDGKARAFGLTNGIQLYKLFRCYLQTLLDNIDEDTRIWGLVPELRRLNGLRGKSDWVRGVDSYAFYKLFAANRVPVTFDWNPKYHQPGDEISRSMITGILDPDNPSTFGFLNNVIPYAEKYQALKTCLAGQPAALGLISVWRQIKDSYWDWNRAETLTKQLQADLKRQLNNPDSELNTEINRLKEVDKNTDKNSGENWLALGALAVGGVLLYNKFLK